MPGRLKVGTIRGRLTLIKYYGYSRWICRCECGNTITIKSCDLSLKLRLEMGCNICATNYIPPVEQTRKGILTSIKDTGKTLNGRKIWLFLCDCGKYIEGLSSNFSVGKIRSCGCIGNAYTSWRSMLGRCYNKNASDYKYYGGRGIIVSTEWLKFDNFIRDMGECPLGHQLSRKNAEGEYSRDNCIWEHYSSNRPDTYCGKPTKPGVLKGAKERKYYVNK